jgi:DNA-binding GntR family transcriptional regulator
MLTAFQLESKAFKDAEQAYAQQLEEEEVEPVVQVCSLKRVRREDGEACAICSDEADVTPPKELVLQLELTEAYIYLCAEHEGLLLQTLLNNYVKRISKCSKAGYIGPLEKEKPDATKADSDCGS